MQYDEVITSLRHYYNLDAEQRDQHPKAMWKQEERQYFSTYLQNAHAHRLLEIGAGTGQDSLFFHNHRLDAVYACNCLLHVPKADLPRVLAQIHTLLQPYGLFYYGVYGGVDKEGVFSDGSEDGSRFFSYFQNDQLPEVVQPYFESLSYKVIPLDGGDRDYYQSLILQKRDYSAVA
jgi:hypothetical protein